MALTEIVPCVLGDDSSSLPSLSSFRMVMLIGVSKTEGTNGTFWMEIDPSLLVLKTLGWLLEPLLLSWTLSFLLSVFLLSTYTVTS